MLLALSHAFQREWISGLVLMWAGLLFGGFALGHGNPLSERRMPTWTRIGSSLVLVILAWSWFDFTHLQPLAPFSLLLALGMSLGWVGDIALAELLPVKQPILLGLAAFGGGHLAYIGAFGLLAFQIGHTDIIPFVGSLVVWFVIGSMVWYLVVFRGHQATLLHRLALLYTLLVAGTAGMATALALQSSVFVPVAIGAALFFISDLILAAQLFKGLHFPFIDDIIWLTYGPAQFLIIFSINSALFLSVLGR